MRGHPQWCARDHRCSAGRLPSGEHRSAPQTWRTGYGTLVVTRVRDVAGREWLESRVVVALSPSDGLARRQAQHLTVGIDLTVRAVLAGALPSDLVDDLLGRVPAVGPVAA